MPSNCPLSKRSLSVNLQKKILTSLRDSVMVILVDPFADLGFKNLIEKKESFCGTFSILKTTSDRDIPLILTTESNGIGIKLVSSVFGVKNFSFNCFKNLRSIFCLLFSAFRRIRRNMSSTENATSAIPKTTSPTWRG